jgi:peptide/nickel transport system substrate-binding protein
VVDEPMTKLAALTAGEIDFAGIQPAHAAFVARNPELVVREYPVLFPTGIVFNGRRPPFDRLEARQAVDRALDRRQLVDGFAWGFATPAEGPVPPELSWGNRVPVDGFRVVRDAWCVRRAEPEGPRFEVLASNSGFPPPCTPRTAHHASGTTQHASPTTLNASTDLHFELLTVGSGEAALEQMVQAQLGRHGITVTIRQLELSAFLSRVYGPAHDFDAALLGTPGDLGLGYLGPLAALSGLQPPTGGAALLRFYHDQLPVSMLYHPHGVQGANRRVRGVVLSLAGELESVTRWEVR